MADKNPFGGLGLGQLGSERQYMSSLLTPEKKREWKQGALGLGFQAIGAEDFFNKMFGEKKPKQQVGIPPNYQFTKDFTPGANLELTGTPIGINPNKINQGLGVVPGSMPQQTMPNSSVDDEINEAWGNKKTSEFKPRDTSLDQLPEQFAQGPIAPPNAQFMQPYQSSGGLSKILTSFLG